LKIFIFLPESSDEGPFVHQCASGQPSHGRSLVKVPPLMELEVSYTHHGQSSIRGHAL
jgi:hypothetical protein